MPNWSDQDFPTAQWYHVVTTAHLPFHVCGSQQDNSTLCVPSNTNAGGGGFGGDPPVAPYQVGGGEPGYIAPHATDPDMFFAGTNNGSFLTRYNRRTGELKEVGAYPRFFSGEPAKDVKERWQWTYPIIFSLRRSERPLHELAARVEDHQRRRHVGQRSAATCSRHDPKTMKESGGPITHDMNSPEIYGTVFSLAPGKKDVNVMWAGSDDGLMHVTRDHGKTWTNVTPADMPDFGRVSQIDGSSFDNGTAYMAVKKMLLGDRSPYIFRTRDYGKTWTKIVNGIPANDYVHTVREDPVRRGLLYAGTQHGVYISFNDGELWQTFNNGLPDVPVTDLVVERQRDRDRHARPQLLRDGRHRGAAPVRPGAADATWRCSSPPTPRAASIAPDRHLLPEGATEGLTHRLPRRQGPGDALDQRPAAAQGQATAGGGGGGGGLAAGRRARRWRRASIAIRGTSTRRRVVSFPGMILWGATQNGPVVLPGSYHGAPHRGRRHADAVVLGAANTRCARSAMPTCSSSGTSPAASATRSTKPTSR